MSYYPTPEEHRAEVLGRFMRRKLTNAAVNEMNLQLREFSSLADTILRRTKPGREQSLALTHLQEAKFWANEAIAAHPDSQEVDA